MHRHLFILLLALFMSLVSGFLMTACGADASEEVELKGRILLWHAWSGTEEEILDGLLDKFNDIYPSISVIAVAYDPDELQEQFKDKVEQGLGPDLLIGSQLWTRDLADAGLLQTIDQEDVDLSLYLAPALNTLNYNDELYGLPLSVHTSALYYNRSLVDEPPETLQELLEQAAEGKTVMLNTDFDSAFWGIQAFGGQLLILQRPVRCGQILDRG